MSQTNENEPDAASFEPPKDLVGDILRKERITRRITVETIARDLKLNVKYIKALETNDYDSLPADPYVRVYLKSLAKYLTLDSEKILKQFYNERGMSIEPSPRESAERIEISMKQKEESRNPLLVVAVVLIILLALFSFIAKKQGWLVAPPSITPLTEPSDTEFIETEPAEDSLLADSLIPVTPPQAVDTPDTQKTTAENIPVDTADLMHFSLTVVKDSVWIQVYSDGDSWKNVVYKNQHRDFAARDSFNVHIGDIAAVKFFFNGKMLPFKGKGVMVFKIDRKGAPLKWTLTHWNRVFKDQL
ncbi:MAG: helix-turn-helix domain-containing protein [Chitinispirillaceae bacterium]|nr:helix-turn-helix domain-containing protein [Chitinispirillaceae bacterium]